MTSSLELHTIVAQSQDLLLSDIDDEVVMLNMETDAYYGLDPVSADIWRRLAQPCTVSAVCDQLLLEYDIEPDMCRQDVLAFITKLIDAKLAHTVSS